ncbi:MinD/ParA family protein [Halobacillus rhizosphaerae]|uniref:MinD/ParA family protein n=1 Tax=Halobacillus rhizosphaerae TaxID=3064889 RepID=UPI00398B1B5D
MKDQAEQLRNRLKIRDTPAAGKTIAIASGKGGVGKSNFTINFALQLVQLNKKVLIFDLDIGMGNIDILLGVSPRYSIVDLFTKDLTIHDIIELGPNNLSYIAGGAGLANLFQLDESKFEYFQSQFSQLAIAYDYILFDMGAGVSADGLSFISAADEAVVVTTPEPTSITDGYSMIKHLVTKDKNLPIYLLLNRALNVHSGQKAFQRLEKVAEHFLTKTIHSLGVIPEDRSVMQAVAKQIPFCINSPKSKASAAVAGIAKRYVADRIEEKERKESSFLTKLKRFVLER